MTNKYYKNEKVEISVPLSTYFNQYGSSYSSYYPGKISSTNSTYGDGVIDWKGKIKRLQSATSPFQGHKMEIFGPCKPDRGLLLGYFSSPNYPIVNTYAGYTNVSEPQNPYDPTDQGLTTARSLASGKFYMKASQALTKFQGGVWLGELDDLLRMLRNPAAGIFGLLENYVNRSNKIRRNIRIPRKTARQAIAESWLETAFGWRQLHNDIVDAANAYTAFLGKPKVEYIHASAESDYDFGGWKVDSHAFNYIWYKGYRWDRQHHKVIYRGVIKHSTFGGALGNALDLVGLNVPQWVPTLWNLLPYSFVIDYFVNINEILTAATFPRSAIAWAQETVVSHRNVSVISSLDQATTRAKATWFTITYLDGGTSQFSYRTKKVTRSAIAAPPVPQLVINDGLSDNVTRQFNVLALIAKARA